MGFFSKLLGTKKSELQWQDDLMSDDWQSKDIFETKDEFLNYLFPRQLMHNQQPKLNIFYETLQSEIIELAKLGEEPSDEDLKNIHDSFILKLKNKLGIEQADNTNFQIKIWERLSIRLLSNDRSDTLRAIGQFLLTNRKSPYRKAWEAHNEIGYVLFFPPNEIYKQKDDLLPASDDTQRNQEDFSISSMLARIKREEITNEQPQTSLEPSATNTVRNSSEVDNELITRHSSPSTTATVTASATTSTKKITETMVLESLWGKPEPDSPTGDSVCGKILTKWNEKQTSPAMIPLPKFVFVKPTSKDVKVEDDGKNIEINLTVKHQAREEIKLNLSRQVNEKKNQETWICQSSDDLISETKQFELIATELFALRKAQGIENAESIGIMSIGEKEDDKKESTQFCCTNDKTVRLSSREEALIEAHIEAGFTVTYGQYEIKKSGSATLNFTI